MFHTNVVNANMSLCAGKSDGVDDICSDNLKHVTDRFIDYIVSLFNSILSHGCVPISFLSSTIIPIPKNPRLDRKNLEYYRAIALSSVFGKFLVQLLLRSRLNSFAHRNYNLATKLKVLLQCVLQNERKQLSIMLVDKLQYMF